METIEYEKHIPVGTFKIIPLIETAGAIVNIKEICTACHRVCAVTFGCEDYVTDLRGKHDPDGNSIFFARNEIVNAARATGVIPIDTVHIKVHDLEDLEKNLKVAKNLGFEGMLILNPKELPLCHQYFSPSEEEVAWATEMVQLADEAVAEGKGVAVKDGKFIGPPMVKMAKNILAKLEKKLEAKKGKEIKFFDHTKIILSLFWSLLLAVSFAFGKIYTWAELPLYFLVIVGGATILYELVWKQIKKITSN